MHLNALLDVDVDVVEAATERSVREADERRRGRPDRPGEGEGTFG